MPELSENTTGLAAPPDILSPAEQRNAQELIADPDPTKNSVMVRITNGLLLIGGQIESFNNASAALANSIQAQDNAANSYLNTNYEDDSNNFKEAVARIKGSIATIVLADRLVQKTERLLEPVVE
ncbi:hypothetical protein [Candidatus Trichorickettsia mobilis]|uniref:hypothetical protein n=1 Tax=Candidatus Trichorickettsia mobilis TaxID=1346319 RepID=UPI00292D8086|nr:hypothetical protein [Candidatus Trichorickettsia mobilis]